MRISGKILLTLAFTMPFVFGAKVSAKDAPQKCSLIVNAYPDQSDGKISRFIYGHFSEHLGHCIYGGFWVGENSNIPNTRGIRNDVVEALKKSKIPVLRWPGGCFADEYHWRDGIGPRDKRPRMVNTNWGNVTEDNSFGTHEFLDLCEQLGCEPYICGNVGSGTVEEMKDWVEYITFDGISPMADMRRQNGHDKPWHLKFFGVGNESWGCGGCMKPEYYSDVYSRYQSFIKNYPGNEIYKIACGSYADELHWTEVLMRDCGSRMNGLSLHNYVGPGDNNSATVFGEKEWFTLMKNGLKYDDIISAHSAVMDRYDPLKKVGLIFDEWGAWYAVEPGTNPAFLYQQNTLRDAMLTGTTLNIFNRHCDRVKMANIAQTVNVLQSLVLTDSEKILLTPTYHVYEMYSVHQDADMLESKLSCGYYHCGTDSIPAVNVSVSRDSAGKIHISLCNLDPAKPAELESELRGIKAGKISGRILTAPEMNTYNTFEKRKM